MQLLKNPHKSGRRNQSASFLLAMLLFRSYVPVGFMPASGTPFLVELCPSVSIAQMPAQHHHHPDTHGHFDSCPFGSAPSAGPIAHFIVFGPTGQTASRPVVAFEPLRPGLSLQRAHLPRGPPSPA